MQDVQDPRPLLLVTGCHELRTTVCRLAALLGLAVDVHEGELGLAAAWRAAALIAVGDDLASRVAQAALPRRDRVIVAAMRPPDELLWRATVALGGARVVRLPEQERELVDLLADALDSGESAGRCVGVVGGSGGAGASTFAAALARTAAVRQPAVLIDGDPLGGGIDVLLGAEALAGPRWPALAGTRGRLPAAALREALPRLDGVAFLSWDRAGGPQPDLDAVAAVAASARRGFPFVVVDLPRHLDPLGGVLAAQTDLVVVVAPAGVRATAAAARAVATLRAHCPRLALVVRALGGPGGSRLAAREVAAAVGLPLVAELPHVPAVATAAQRGEPPLRRLRGPLVPACRRVLQLACDERGTA